MKPETYIEKFQRECDRWEFFHQLVNEGRIDPLRAGRIMARLARRAELFALLAGK